MHIYVKGLKDGSYKCTSVNLSHSHAVTRRQYLQAPKVRALTEEQQSEVRGGMVVNTRLVMYRQIYRQTDRHTYIHKGNNNEINYTKDITTIKINAL